MCCCQTAARILAIALLCDQDAGRGLFRQLVLQESDESRRQSAIHDVLHCALSFSQLEASAEQPLEDSIVNLLGNLLRVAPACAATRLVDVLMHLLQGDKTSLKNQGPLLALFDRLISLLVMNGAKSRDSQGLLPALCRAMVQFFHTDAARPQATKLLCISMLCRVTASSPALCLELLRTPLASPAAAVRTAALKAMEIPLEALSEAVLNEDTPGVQPLPGPGCSTVWEQTAHFVLKQTSLDSSCIVREAGLKLIARGCALMNAGVEELLCTLLTAFRDTSPRVQRCSVLLAHELGVATMRPMMNSSQLAKYVMFLAFVTELTCIAMQVHPRGAVVCVCCHRLLEGHGQPSRCHCHAGSRRGAA
jgi:hypothetical protein